MTSLPKWLPLPRADIVSFTNGTKRAARRVALFHLADFPAIKEALVPSYETLLAFLVTTTLFATSQGLQCSMRPLKPWRADGLPG